MLIDETLVLTTESDVEQKVVMPLLVDQRLLAIPEANVYTKQYLAPAALDKAAGKLIGYPRRMRSSTRVDAPQPTSIMEAESESAARSTSARDVSRCAQYQLTESGVLVE